MTLEEMNAKYGKPPTAPSAGGSRYANAWGTQPKEKTLSENITSHISEAVKNPLETGKGIVKGIPGGAASVTKGLDMVTSKISDVVPEYLQPGPVRALTEARKMAGIKEGETTLDYTDVEELTAPSNDAQETGYVAAQFLPVERAFTASKPLVEEGIKAVKPLVSATKEFMANRATNKNIDFVKNLITPELNKVATTEAIKTGKVTEAGFRGTRDITKAVPFFEDTQKAVLEVPGISPKKTLLENANAIHDHIGVVADDLVSQLKTSAKEMKISNIAEVPAKFTKYMEDVKATLKENPTLVGDAEKTATKILDKFESLVKEEGSTPDAILSARKKLDAWMSTQKGDNVFDPKTEGAVSVALRAIRQGGNDFISKLSTDVKVKDMLAKQTSLYNAIENIAPKAAKEGANWGQRWAKSHPNIMKSVKTAGALGAAGVLGGAASSVIFGR